MSCLRQLSYMTMASSCITLSCEGGNAYWKEDALVLIQHHAARVHGMNRNRRTVENNRDRQRSEVEHLPRASYSPERDRAPQSLVQSGARLQRPSDASEQPLHEQAFVLFQIDSGVHHSHGNTSSESEAISSFFTTHVESVGFFLVALIGSVLISLWLFRLLCKRTEGVRAEETKKTSMSKLPLQQNPKGVLAADIAEASTVSAGVEWSARMFSMPSDTSDNDTDSESGEFPAEGELKDLGVAVAAESQELWTGEQMISWVGAAVGRATEADDPLAGAMNLWTEWASVECNVREDLRQGVVESMDNKLQSVGLSSRLSILGT